MSVVNITSDRRALPVYAFDTMITGFDIKILIDLIRRRDQHVWIYILSGSHGSEDGSLGDDAGFDQQDMLLFGNLPRVCVRPVNYDTHKDYFQRYLDKDVIVIFGWCYSSLWAGIRAYPQHLVFIRRRNSFSGYQNGFPLTRAKSF